MLNFFNTNGDDRNSMYYNVKSDKSNRFAFVFEKFVDIIDVDLEYYESLDINSLKGDFSKIIDMVLVRKIDKRSAVIINEQCCICMEDIDIESAEDLVTIRDCQHGFCAKCLFFWLNQRRSCPLCITPCLNVNFLVEDYDENNDFIEEDKDEDAVEDKNNEKIKENINIENTSSSLIVSTTSLVSTRPRNRLSSSSSSSSSSSLSSSLSLFSLSNLCRQAIVTMSHIID